MIGCQSVAEVEGEERGAQSRPEEAEEEEEALVAPALVPVLQQQPELEVHDEEETSIQTGVQGGKAQLHRRGHSRLDGKGVGGVGRNSGGGVGFHFAL